MSQGRAHHVQKIILPNIRLVITGQYDYISMAGCDITISISFGVADE
jgi:hypothetical protein